MLASIPLLIVPFLAYNLGLAGLFGEGVDGYPWADTILSLRMMSGGVFTMTLGDLMVLIGLVCFFVEILGEGQPKISRHLAYLRRAGIVKARRDGKWMHYRIVPPPDPNAAEVLRGVMAWLAGEPAMRRDRERLSDVCCAVDPPPELAGAPRPVQIELGK